MMDFEQWYDLLVDALKDRGETKRPDKDTARQDFESGFTPEYSAQEFYDEWNT